MNKNLTDAALEYIEMGISVVPVYGKVPVASWKEFQTRFANEDDLRAWQTTNPTGIAAITGVISGICVVDLDDLEHLSTYDWPETVRAESGRGVHLYFQYPSGKFIPSKSAVVPGLDVKGHGGLITLPPSLHLSTGKAYAWEVSFEREALADLPLWIVEKLDPPRKTMEDSFVEIWPNLQRMYVDGQKFINTAMVDEAKEVAIESLLAGRVGMKRNGRETMVGLCPFHDEKTPSFTAFIGSNSYYCFGCDKGGDVIDLAMGLNDYTFSEAVRWLLRDKNAI